MKKGIKKLYLVLVYLLVLIVCNITSVNAEIITPSGGWQLDSYQYSQVLNSAGTDYVRESTSYGFYAPGTGQLYRMGAFIMDNGGCSNDYCLQPNTSYVVTFFYKSKNVNFKCNNKDNPIPYLDISYYNASGQKISINYDDNVSNMYASCNNNTYTVSVVISFGDLGEISHINGFDLYWDINATNYDDARLRGILYTGGGQFGLFGVEVDTDIKGYLDKIEQLKQNDSTNDKLDDVTGAIVDTNDKLDDMLNADANASVNPDDSNYDDYESVEGSLKDKVSQADLTNLSIGIDNKSSSWVWNTLTSFIQTNNIVFGMFIAILSIGVIKLALGR